MTDMLSAALAVLLASYCLAQNRYDLLLRGGHVIDPKNRVDEVRDVAIQNGRIAAVGKGLDSTLAHKVVDVHGYVVTPGIIDLHTHVFAAGGLAGGTGAAGSVWPDSYGPRSCVTTMVDAGTSGYQRFPEFKRSVIDKSITRVLAFINIVGAGLAGAPEQDTGQMDVEAAVAMAKKFPETVVGFKTAHYQGPDWTAVDRVLAAGKQARLPVMVDFGTFPPERPFEDLVTIKLRPGDIYTHLYLYAVPMLDANGKVRDYLWQARKRGVKFDTGHGMGSFLFRQAVPAVQQGFVPDSISSDLHYGDMNGPMSDMVNILSKFLNMGLTLDDLVLRATWNPAQQIHRKELGSLTVGAPADVAILRIDKGIFGFVDVWGGRFSGTQRLACQASLRDGKFVYDPEGLTRADWTMLPKNYGNQADPVIDRILEKPEFADLKKERQRK